MWFYIIKLQLQWTFFTTLIRCKIYNLLNFRKFYETKRSSGVKNNRRSRAERRSSQNSSQLIPAYRWIIYDASRNRGSVTTFRRRLICVVFHRLSLNPSTAVHPRPCLARKQAKKRPRGLVAWLSWWKVYTDEISARTCPPSLSKSPAGSRLSS